LSKPDCYKCTYRKNLPGDTHSKCIYPNNEVSVLDLFSTANQDNGNLLDIQAISHGVKKGWFNWPVNFDPVWLTNCNGFTSLETVT